MYQDREKRDGENFVMQNENRDLRDRIEILENVIGAQTYDVQQDAWRDLLYPTMKGSESESATTAPSEERKSEDQKETEEKAEKCHRAKAREMFINGVLVEAWRKLHGGDHCGARQVRKAFHHTHAQSFPPPDHPCLPLPASPSRARLSFPFGLPRSREATC